MSEARLHELDDTTPFEDGNASQPGLDVVQIAGTDFCKWSFTAHHFSTDLQVVFLTPTTASLEDRLVY